MSAFGRKADMARFGNFAAQNNAMFDFSSSLLRVKARTVLLNGWRDPMPHNGELIFAVVIVGIPSARLRLFAPLRRRFAC